MCVCVCVWMYAYTYIICCFIYGFMYLFAQWHWWGMAGEGRFDALLFIDILEDISGYCRCHRIWKTSQGMYCTDTLSLIICFLPPSSASFKSSFQGDEADMSAHMYVTVFLECHACMTYCMQNAVYERLFCKKFVNFFGWLRMSIIILMQICSCGNMCDNQYAAGSVKCISQ